MSHTSTLFPQKLLNLLTDPVKNEDLSREIDIAKRKLHFIGT